jgi:CheY-specific phosphatase CheX
MTSAVNKPDLRRIGESAFTEVAAVCLSLPVTVRGAPSQDLAGGPDPVRSSGFSRLVGGEPAEAGTPSGQAPQAGAGDQLVSRVALAGSRLAGSVQIQLPEAFIARAVRRLTGLEGAAPAGAAVLADAAGELANMVAGRVTAQLAAHGYPCTLGTPAVSRNADWPPALEPGAEHGRVEVWCDGHALSLQVQCRYAVP